MGVFCVNLPAYRGAVLVRNDNGTLFEEVKGFADEANERLNRLDTRFQVASGSKGFVAVGILKLIEEGKLTFHSRLSDLVDFDLEQIDPEVTVEQLLTHTSGVPDYFDESIMDDYDELWVDYPCYKIRKSEDLLPLFIHKPMMYPRGKKFQYNNTGFVLLGIIIEKVTGMLFDQYLKQVLFDPAGMDGTGYFESDRLPGNCANAYMRDRRTGGMCTNIFAVDAKGTGAGGAFTSVIDMDKFWRALYSGKIISPEMLRKATTVHAGEGDAHYGLGFWLNDRGNGFIPSLEGCDPGVCFMSEFDPHSGTTATVISNYGDDVWALHEALREYYTK